ncbi:hypothetical protein [Methylobacterium gnaphalii]|uniref:Uncharacterized protein n=1 Tax=Methylobacterium gnaphalii TaxID=1010610 RepID=A0A512JIM4_9HYPH|nr:hypothetical protein [Methylobacterium gnaphalii]GEP09773.1 hypothetical protein MGN01_16180 [Methylobacterium gnaphalii]GJD67311.1 hypothetical protein MMMDOFMJ_0225 [Methylobacterium gnaphalii]GLS49803.1 hypothetical protein GCM10007885_26550 [Methylobacterium gnaphalii]
MSDIRKQRAFDGRCTVFAGDSLIISNLSDETADLIVAHFSSTETPASAARTLGGRGLGASPDLPRVRATSRRTR